MRSVIFAVLPASCCFALDLQPEHGFRELEGFKFPVVRFADSGGKVRWSPPANWAMQYENKVLTLNPPQAQSAFEIRVVPRTAGDRDILTKLDGLQKYCGQFLSAAAKDLQYKSTTEGPFTIGPTPAREYVFEYSQSGLSYKSSISMLDLSERERLVVVITAQARDFDEVRDTAIQSMFSWQAE